MSPFLISLMSGPLMAAVRYGITAGTAALASKYAIDGQTTAAVANGLIAAASAGIGMLTSTRAANVTRVAGIPGAKVQLPNGTTVANKETAAATIAADPTWDNPNAR